MQYSPPAVPSKSRALYGVGFDASRIVSRYSVMDASACPPRVAHLHRLITYLAIRNAVAEIPPLLTAGVRHLTAGCVLCAWARAKGYRASGRRESWGTSVVYAQRAAMPQNPTLRTATTLLCGHACLLVTSLVAGEYHEVAAPSWLALGSLAYLIVFGSIVAFTASLAARSLLRHAGVHAHIRESGSGGAPRLGVRR